MAKIRYAEVMEYCNEMHVIANRMKDTIETIENNCSTMSKSEIWSGAASDFYVAKLKKLTTNFDEAYRELESAILFMAKCSDGYEAIDKNVVQEICSNLRLSEASLNNSNIFSGFN